MNISGTSAMRFRFSLLISFLGVLLALSLPAAAQDHITERAWVEDHGGQLNLAQVQALPLQPFNGVLSRGFGRSAIWLRLHIDPQARPPAKVSPEELVLRIRPMYLDEIQVFDPLVPGVSLGTLGDRFPPHLDPLQGLDFMMPIQRGSASRDVWLRMTSTSTRQIEVQALNHDDLTKTTFREGLLFSFYICMVLLLFTLGLIKWMLTREPLVMPFVAKQLAALLFALGSMGFLRAFWPASWPPGLLDSLASLFSVMAVTAAVFFHHRFLNEYRPARWAHMGLLGLLGLSLFNFVLLAFSQTMLALQINMSIVLLGPMVCMACAFTGRAWSNQRVVMLPLLPRPLLIGLYGGLMLLLIMGSLPGLALAQGNVLTLYISQIHGLVISVLLLVILQYRTHLLQTLRRQAQRSFEHANLQARHERHAREDQEKLLTMLTHELKTPLATMHMRMDANASGNREIRQAIRDMNAVIERCVQATQMGEKQIQPSLQMHDLTHILRDAISACAQPERVKLLSPLSLLQHTDSQLFFIVVGNLLDNACKYSAPGTPIELRIEALPDHPTGPCMTLTVSNQPGTAGWPESERLFEKYYRAPHAQRQMGTGLGLYLVQHLANTLGGQIDYSPDAQSVRFVLRLPSPHPAQFWLSLGK